MESSGDFGIRESRFGNRNSGIGIRDEPRTPNFKTVILFDSNFLMMPFQFGINLDMEMERVFGVYNAIVPTSVVRELEGLAKEGGKDGAAARGALKLAARYKTVETPEREADEALVRLALENREKRWIVATNDRYLRRRLAHVTPVLIMRGKSHLEVVE